MFATTEDLKLCSRASTETQHSDDSCGPGVASRSPTLFKHTVDRSGATSSDSADEIQVLEDQPVAIPIRTALDRRQADRHSDLDIGSVHSRKRRSSPLFERRKRDDLDLLSDFMDSTDDEWTCDVGRDHKARGRERRTKPLLRPKQASPPHRPQRYDYSVAGMTAYSPQSRFHPDRGYSPESRRPIDELDPVEKNLGRYHLKGLSQKHARYSHQAPQSLLSGLEQEAMVFDNFEDIRSPSRASEHEWENKDPFDAHLHFVRPAMSICANPGAFVALEPIVTPASSVSESSDKEAQAVGIRAQSRPQRLGHHRAVSELFSSSTSSAKAADVRATRRRATVGSEAAYRVPFASRHANLSA